MLQMERDIRAVQSYLVMTERVGEGLTEIRAHDILIAELSSQGCTSQQPVEIAVQVDAEDIRAVVVEGYSLLRAACQLETVVTTVPIDSGMDVKLSSLALTSYLIPLISPCSAVLSLVVFSYCSSNFAL